MGEYVCLCVSMPKRKTKGKEVKMEKQMGKIKTMDDLSRETMDVPCTILITIP